MSKRPLDEHEPEAPARKRACLQLQKQDVEWLRELHYYKNVESMRLTGVHAKARAAIVNIHMRGPVLPRVAPLTEDEQRELARCERRLTRCQRDLDEHEQERTRLGARISEMQAALCEEN